MFNMQQNIIVHISQNSFRHRVGGGSYQQNFNSIEIINLNSYSVNFLKLILCFCVSFNI